MNAAVAIGPAENAAAFSTALALSVPPSQRLVVCDGDVGLRQFYSADLQPLYEATVESLGGLCAWMNWCRADYSIEDCRRFLADTAAGWERGSEYNFAIVARERGLLHGTIALNRIDRAQSCANVGYWVRQTQAGRGIGSSALQLVSRFAFTELALERLEIIVPEGNIASRRVAEKAGARIDTVPGRALTLNGKTCSAKVYSLQREMR
jgi:ribosomal-protein-serine acetyltransferase